MRFKTLPIFTLATYRMGFNFSIRVTPNINLITVGLVKNMPIMPFWLPESWIFNMEPQYCSKHLQWLSMVIYDWKWYASMCCGLFLYLWWSPVQKNCQKCAKYTDFASSWITNVQSGPLILCRDIFNDYL